LILIVSDSKLVTLRWISLYCESFWLFPSLWSAVQRRMESAQWAFSTSTSYNGFNAVW